MGNYRQDSAHVWSEWSLVVPSKERNLDPEFLAKLDVLTAREAAVYLRTSTSTLAKYRIDGRGPTFIRQSARKVLYRRADLDAWLASRARKRTYEPVLSDRAA